MSGSETSGLDLARVALRTVMEAARANGGPRPRGLGGEIRPRPAVLREPPGSVTLPRAARIFSQGPVTRHPPHARARAEVEAARRMEQEA
ncbi:hypothetical protein ACFY1C_35720 [Streptomyces sp. NPDC001279]|uniref:hypothetical protein n=1 Tax=Streptomyces sp. NPDC001279 TaxID=3364556 RepID=UPI0036891E80